MHFIQPLIGNQDKHLSMMASYQEKATEGSYHTYQIDSIDRYQLIFPLSKEIGSSHESCMRRQPKSVSESRLTNASAINVPAFWYKLPVLLLSASAITPDTSTAC